ncbi:MAG: hypothetical protein K6D91_06125 [Prevotella sp.]|nr:hypothetical protein [Prevotella sp.]
MKRLLMIIVLALMVGTICAQSGIKRQGNTFIEVSNKQAKGEDIKTPYTYKAKDGKIYPIFRSKNGKYYIIRTSKKSGKEYKQYLPQVTEALCDTTKS